MNNSPFTLSELIDTWAVSWPKWKNIKEFDTKKKLLSVLFDDIKCDEVGIAIAISMFGDDIDVMWIPLNTWAQDINGDYAAYLEDMYEIKGVIFKHKDEAIRFKEYLEKKLVWKILKT